MRFIYYFITLSAFVTAIPTTQSSSILERRSPKGGSVRAGTASRSRVASASKLQKKGRGNSKKKSKKGKKSKKANLAAGSAGAAAGSGTKVAAVKSLAADGGKGLATITSTAIVTAAIKNLIPGLSAPPPPPV